MRILLACAAGMSTSLLANNMQKLATERALEVTVEATSTSALDDATWQRVDVVLVGPQMRHLLPEISAQGAQYGVPVAAIPPQDYATANAHSVLEQATALVEQDAFKRDAGL
ncbi:MAG TPA: PTS sugar transporter subunit IIB [Armatimonadota bacterium]|nr:PTS sugar transporter subunit IIB [Armatimonadota bacterium]